MNYKGYLIERSEGNRWDVLDSDWNWLGCFLTSKNAKLYVNRVIECKPTIIDEGV